MSNRKRDSYKGKVDATKIAVAIVNKAHVVSSAMTRKASAEIVTRVKCAIHEMVAQEQIQALIENRLRDELTGKIEKGDALRIAPTILRIAAETWNPSVGAPREGDKHVHFHGWTPEQMLEYARTGKKPELPLDIAHSGTPSP